MKNSEMKEEGKPWEGKNVLQIKCCNSIKQKKIFLYYFILWLIDKEVSSFK